MKTAFRSVLLLVLCIGLLGGPAPRAADMGVEVLEVTWRSATDIADDLRQGLSPSGSLTVEERLNRVVVRDYPGNIEAVKAILQSLDTRPRQVKLTIDFVRSSAVDRDALQVARVEGGAGWRIGTLSKSGVRVELGTRRYSDEDRLRQTLLLKEGAEAEVVTGAEIYRPVRLKPFLPEGDSEYFDKYFIPCGAGVTVVSRPAGERIEVTLTPMLISIGNREQVRMERFSATLLLKPGEKTVIGGGKEGSGSFSSYFLDFAGGEGEHERFLLTLQGALEGERSIQHIE